MRLYCKKQSHCLFSRQSNTSVKHHFVKPICITKAKKAVGFIQSSKLCSSKEPYGNTRKPAAEAGDVFGRLSYEIHYILYVNSQPIQRSYTSHTYTSLFCHIYTPLCIFIVNFPECRCTAQSSLIHCSPPMPKYFLQEGWYEWRETLVSTKRLQEVGMKSFTTSRALPLSWQTARR